MTISELITKLEAIRQEHGDLTVQKYFIDGRRHDVGSPAIGYTKILTKRESRPDFWGLFDGLEARGEKVCKI